MIQIRLNLVQSASDMLLPRAQNLDYASNEIVRNVIWKSEAQLEASFGFPVMIGSRLAQSCWTIFQNVLDTNTQNTN
jgi:hypothetical protein